MVLKNKIICWSLTAFLVGLPLNGLSIELYRYTDEKGTPVINNRLPAKYAAQGYDILDSNGRLIKTVPREATEEERLQQKADRDRQEKQQQYLNQQADYDLALLKKFSFISDIEAEQVRKVAELNVRVSILKGNLKSLRSELDIEYDKAADSERASSKVSQMTQDRIQNLEKQIISTEALLAKHVQDIEKLNKDYDRAKSRFRELMAIKNHYRIKNNE